MANSTIEKYLITRTKSIKNDKDYDKWKAKIANHRYIIIRRFEDDSVIDQIFDKDKNKYVEDGVTAKKLIKEIKKENEKKGHPNQITIDEAIAEAKAESEAKYKKEMDKLKTAANAKNKKLEDQIKLALAEVAKLQKDKKEDKNGKEVVNG